MNNQMLARELVKLAKSLVAIGRYNTKEEYEAEDKEFKKWVDEKKSRAPKQISLYGSTHMDGPFLHISLLITYPGNGIFKKDIEGIVKYCNEVIKYGDKVAAEFKQKWPYGTLEW